MAGYKRIKQSRQPKSGVVGRSEDPDKYYSQHPSWNFNGCDEEKWASTEACVGDLFWTELLPHLKSWETQTWSQILVDAKKQNHAIVTERLNPIAQKRLAERFIEAESIISLRISGTHRIYGYMVGAVFHILWYDFEHGDNPLCVCRSYKKHT